MDYRRQSLRLIGGSFNSMRTVRERIEWALFQYMQTGQFPPAEQWREMVLDRYDLAVLCYWKGVGMLWQSWFQG